MGPIYHPLLPDINFYLSNFLPFYSPATTAEVVHYACQFLMRKESVLSDTTYTEFDDLYLTQNVKSIAVTDVDSMQTNSTTNQVFNQSKHCLDGMQYSPCRLTVCVAVVGIELNDEFVFKLNLMKIELQVQTNVTKCNLFRVCPIPPSDHVAALSLNFLKFFKWLHIKFLTSSLTLEV